jgi:hypothetical protein
VFALIVVCFKRELIGAFENKESCSLNRAKLSCNSKDIFKRFKIKRVINRLKGLDVDYLNSLFLRKMVINIL